MPFTPAHAAAALPFRPSRLPVAAITIGCLAPDLLYFLRLAPRGRFGHTLPGVFLFDLPMSLGLFWIWRAYLRPATLAVVVSEEKGVSALAKRRWSGQFALLVVAGILIGVFSHILWDSFTHHGFWPYHHIALMRRVFVVPGLGSLRGYEWLQMISSIAGLVILAIWFRNYWREPSHGAQFHIPMVWRGRIVAAILFAVAVGVLRSFWGIRGIQWPYASALFITEFLVTFLDALFLAWLGAAMVVTARLARSRRQALADA